jgi:hypothetical protein
VEEMSGPQPDIQKDIENDVQKDIENDVRKRIEHIVQNVIEHAAKKLIDTIEKQRDMTQTSNQAKAFCELVEAFGKLDAAVHTSSYVSNVEQKFYFNGANPQLEKPTAPSSPYGPPKDDLSNRSGQNPFSLGYFRWGSTILGTYSAYSISSSLVGDSFSAVFSGIRHPEILKTLFDNFAKISYSHMKTVRS